MISESVDQFISFRSNIFTIESIVNICKAWSTIDRSSTISKYDLSDKIKWEFFQTVAVSVLL